MLIFFLKVHKNDNHYNEVVIIKVKSRVSQLNVSSPFITTAHKELSDISINRQNNQKMLNVVSTFINSANPGLQLAEAK